MISAKTTQNDMNLCRQHAGEYFASPEKLPVSYVYGGKMYKGLPENSVLSSRFLDANIVETVISGKNGELGIRAECLTYRDYPVVEWTVYFTCSPGENKTKILENVLCADMSFDGSGVLEYCNGDGCSPESYTVSYQELSENTVFTQTGTRGRPCSENSWPYQRVMFGDWGMNLSIGWPAQWACEYKGSKSGFAFKAGQETVHTYITIGETFRTPRMSFMFFEGGRTRGINIWRRWFNAHVTPRQKGGLLEPKAVFFDSNGGREWESANEENLLGAVEYVKENFPGHNLFWVDAGWYPCEFPGLEKQWPNTGDWRPDPERFPNGFASIGKACKDAKIEFLVWFEIERIRKGSQTGAEIPKEWQLWPSSGRGQNWDDNSLLNFGHPDAQKWICESIANLIKESGIVCYREDYNWDVLDIWRDNETKDRKGMVENLHVQGHLAYWDYLLLNVPDLWIDSCASGGRRNDMESMRRSVPLHPTDYGYGYHHINQAFRHTLMSWFPYTISWGRSWDEGTINPPGLDEYRIINGFGAMTYFCNSTEGPKEWRELSPENFEKLKKYPAVWKRFAEIMLNGDFYPLTKAHRSEQEWTVFQFDSPESGKGVFQVLRNRQSADESLTVNPHGFCDREKYILTNGLTGETRETTGADINKSGVTFTQPARSGSVWFYETSAR